MIGVLRNSAYAKLFSAQVLALLGTGLLTVALALLAYEIAGSEAGVVMGTALTIKMVAYVFVSPVMAALTARFSRKAVLVAADAARASIALALPWVSETWHIYVLIFLLQSASATFTPAYQAVLPSILPEERDYTRALSLSRLAYDLESLVSPLLAAALLLLLSYNNLFVGTAIGFVLSLLLVLATAFPARTITDRGPFLRRLTEGTRVYLRAAELRSLLAMNLAVATVTAMVIVNSVVLVREELGRGESDVALLLAAYGAGSMLVALLMPRALDRLRDRTVMLSGAALLPVALFAVAGVIAMLERSVSWFVIMALWTILGASISLVLTPSARLLRRASNPGNRDAVFAAQFSVSHACFMLTYPLAGALGSSLGLSTTAAILGAVALVGAGLAVAAWRPTTTQAETAPVETG